MRVYIPFYSRYGNVARMAEAVALGVRQVSGVEAKLAYIRDSITPKEAIEKDKRWKETYARLCENYPAATRQDWAGSEAVILGTPTRFGNMSAQVKALVDEMADVWMQGSTIDKIFAAFTATASMHGGQETTLLSTFIPMMHLGMIIVGIPYSEKDLISTTSGGTPYGASAVVGPMADRPPTETDLNLCKALGKRVAGLTARLWKK